MATDVKEPQPQQTDYQRLLMLFIMAWAVVVPASTSTVHSLAI